MKKQHDEDLARMKGLELEEFRQGVDAIQEEEEHPAPQQEQQPSQQYYDEGDDNQSSQNQQEESGDTYIGEFQTEYINQEVYNMFENEGLITRDDLYICAKAMGSWTQ